MSRKIYQKKNFSIYQVSNGYIVHNVKKPFKIGHTHVNNYYKAKSIIDLALRKKIPSKLNIWEIECLLRITDDDSYKKELKERSGVNGFN